MADFRLHFHCLIFRLLVGGCSHNGEQKSFRISFMVAGDADDDDDA